MPRKPAAKESPAKLQQNLAMWGIYGKEARVLPSGWDPKQVQLVDALLHVISSGATVVLRPGSGGGAVGVAIWEGDLRHPAVWCYTSEELDQWAEGVMQRVGELEAAED